MTDRNSVFNQRDGRSFFFFHKSKNVSQQTEYIKNLTEQIKEFEDIETTIKKRKKQMQSSLELIDNIVAEGAISDTHLRMLIDIITVTEKNGELKISITLNGDFRAHFDTYDKFGQIIERYAEIWWFPEEEN